jgi:hypothetical protein
LFRGVQMEAVESLLAEAFSTDQGPIAADGRLLIEMADTLVDADAETAAN